MSNTNLVEEHNDRLSINLLLGKEKLFVSRGAMHWSSMTGKMFGKRAIGRPMTSRCLDNQKIEGCICQKCYASTINKVYPALGAALQRNRDVSWESIVDDPAVFTNVDPTWRSNWNGDYEDERDILVDFNLCNSMPSYICTAWTKNIQAIESLYDKGIYKPSNFTLMQSSHMINHREKRSHVADQVFTIYTAEYAAEHNVKINCIGACRLCKRCYGPLKDRPIVVNELLKGEETKYFKLMGLIE